MKCFKVLSLPISSGYKIPSNPSFAGIEINGIAGTIYTAIQNIEIAFQIKLV